jgi:hypothetical protein
MARMLWPGRQAGMPVAPAERRRRLSQTIVASHDAFPSADQQRTDHHRIYGTALAAANHRAGAQPFFQQPVRSSLPNNQLNPALKFLGVYSANCRSNTQSADCGGWGVSMLTAGFLPWPRHQILVQGAARPRNVVVAAQTACLTKVGPDDPLVASPNRAPQIATMALPLPGKASTRFKFRMKAVVADYGYPL